MKNLVRHAVVLSAVVLLFAGTAAYAAGVDVKEGEWELSSETSMAMRGMSMPPRASKSTYCVTRDDLVPKSEKNNDCRIVQRKITGNKVSWRMECRNGEGEGEITYRGTTYKGTFRMKTVEDGQTMTMNMKLDGRHLGPCPKGAKSGPTGETAERMAATREAVARSRKQQAEMESRQQKAEAFLNSAVVPADEADACRQKGFRWTPGCDEKVGKLNLEDGEYEITVEEANRFDQGATLAQAVRKTVSVGENDPVPQDLLDGQSVGTVKRGKNRITWTASRQGMESAGGITYRGTSFEGVVRTETNGPGVKMLQVRKVTGKRIGEAKRAVGRPVMGRDYSAKPAEGEGGDSSGTGKILKNPVKGIKKLFGF